MRRVVIGTRGSDLALYQAKHVAEMLRAQAPELEVVLDIISSRGDTVRDIPIAMIGGKGVFTKELEVALLEGKIDLAVHSLKDLPTDLPVGLRLGAIAEREDPRDAFLSQSGMLLKDLPAGARVGTSSPRRQAQLRAARPDLEICDIRGNVPTRLRKLETGEYDGIVLAVAGLRRLHLDDAITEILPAETMVSAVGQGALGIEVRDNEAWLQAILDALNDEGAAAETAAERALLHGLGGGCQTPLGALGRVEGETLHLLVAVCSPDGGNVMRREYSGRKEAPAALGEQAAQALLAEGAADLVRASSPGVPQPLTGRRIVVTRPREQSLSLLRALERLGAEVIEFPTIQVRPLPRPEAVGRARDFDWLIFTSANGVRYFTEALVKHGRSVAEFRGISICAIGPATAEATLTRGLPVTLTPADNVAEGILEAIENLEGSLTGKRFLMPRGDKARVFLPEALRARGANVVEYEVYETVPDIPAQPMIESLMRARPHLVTFTSSSTATQFIAALGAERLEALKAFAEFATIGPITTETVEAAGLRVAVEPEQYDVPHLVDAIVAHYES